MTKPRVWSSSDQSFAACISRAFIDGVVLRRGNLYPIRAASREHDTVGKHEQHLHTRNVRLDARENFPQPVPLGTKKTNLASGIHKHRFAEPARQINPCHRSACCTGLHHISVLRIFLAEVTVSRHWRF